LFSSLLPFPTPICRPRWMRCEKGATAMKRRSQGVLRKGFGNQTFFEGLMEEYGFNTFVF